MRRRLPLAGMLVVFVTGLGVAGVRATAEPALQDAPPPDPRLELGRLLFWDPILSGDRDVACATCHHPDFAYADGREISLGAGAVGLGPDRVDASGGAIPVVRRNSQTILNTAFNGAEQGRGGRGRGRRASRFDGTVASVNQAAAPMFWDNRVRSLEAQALEPIKALEEMRGLAWTEDEAVAAAVARVQAIPEYVKLFDAAFGPDTAISADTLGQAIAAFERSLIGMNSPFDRYQAGDTGALTAPGASGSGRRRCATSPSPRPTCTTGRSRHSKTSCASMTTDGRSIRTWRAAAAVAVAAGRALTATSRACATCPTSR